MKWKKVWTEGKRILFVKFSKTNSTIIMSSLWKYEITIPNFCLTIWEVCICVLRCDVKREALDFLNKLGPYIPLVALWLFATIKAFSESQFEVTWGLAKPQVKITESLLTC